MQSLAVDRKRLTMIIAGLLGGLALALFWLLVTGDGSAAPQKPHNVPVAVVGPRPAAAQLATGLKRDNAFRVIAAPAEAQARDLVDRRKADAIINLETRRLETVQAASMPAAIALPQIFSSPQSPVKLQKAEIKPLKSDDPTGLGLMFLTMCAVLAGLPSGVALAYMLKTRRPTSLGDAGARAAVILAFSVLAGLLISVMTDVVLGYGGSRLLVVWGWTALLCAASMGTAAALVGAMGPAGALVAAIPILFFGVASAPAPSPWNFQSGIFRTLGPFDAFGATTNGVRNGIFFRDASQAQNIWVLAVWIAVPILVMLALGWRSQRARAAARATSAVPQVELEAA